MPDALMRRDEVMRQEILMAQEASRVYMDQCDEIIAEVESTFVMGPPPEVTARYRGALERRKGIIASTYALPAGTPPATVHAAALNLANQVRSLLAELSDLEHQLFPERARRRIPEFAEIDYRRVLTSISEPPQTSAARRMAKRTAVIAPIVLLVAAALHLAPIVLIAAVAFLAALVVLLVRDS